MIQPWLSQLITSTLPGCICNYCEQVHYSASSPQSWRFNLEMLPGILTLLITTVSSTFSHRDETLWTSGRGKAHNYFRFCSEGSTGGEDVVFTQRRLPNWALVGKLCEHCGKRPFFPFFLFFWGWIHKNRWFWSLSGNFKLVSHKFVRSSLHCKMLVLN